MKNNFCTQSKRSAFTLIEVMMAVMIISVVIMALLQMMGNSTHIFAKIKNNTKANQYLSFLIASKNYGFENKNITLDKLADDFSLDFELRKKLKRLKAKVIYTQLESIDMAELDESQNTSSLVFELGKSTLKFEDSSSSFIRLRLQ